VTAAAYQQVIDAPARERLDLFLATANRLGAPIGNVEKDFWVCWTLNALYHELPAGPRLLFKGGTSLSKAFGLIQRFSEDIDLTVFRDDLNETASVEELEQLSGKKRKAKLEAIREACRTHVQGPLLTALSSIVEGVTKGAGRVEVDASDEHGQTLLIWYPEVEPRDAGYVRPVVRLELGAKSALDPSQSVTLRPYVAAELPNRDLSVPDVLTIEPVRTFWDKIVILHGLKRWFERRGELRQGGERVSRHYYDLHCLKEAGMAASAAADQGLGADCVRHARMFFDRPDFDLASAVTGSFALTPTKDMADALERDYANMAGMIFGTPPAFSAVLASVAEIDGLLNAPPPQTNGNEPSP